MEKPPVNVEIVFRSPEPEVVPALKEVEPKSQSLKTVNESEFLYEFYPDFPGLDD